VRRRQPDAKARVSRRIVAFVARQCASQLVIHVCACVFTTRGILLRRRRSAYFYESRILTRVNGLLKAVSSYIFGLKDA